MNIYISFLGGVMLFILEGCASYKKMKFPTHECGQDGPGLFSGEKGYFEIDGSYLDKITSH